MRTSIAVLTVVLSCATTAAQSPDVSTDRRAFEVVSVQASLPRATRRPASIRGTRFEAKGQTLASLIAFAYGINANRIVGGPNWLDFDSFDIAARAPSGTSPAQQRQMIQSLLADRFRLVVRNENQLQEAWALVSANGALKIKPAVPSDFTGCRSVPQPAGATAVIQEQDCRSVTMGQIATVLQSFGARYFTGAVTDATGLSGTWDARIAVTPAPARAAAGDGISVFDAAERLGLKLERRDTPVPVLTVVSASRTPTPDAPGATAALARASVEFELATVRPVAPGTAPAGRGGSVQSGAAVQPNGRILLRNMTLRDLISFAWDVPADMVVGGPAFVGTDRFEIVADAPGSMPRPVDVDEFRPMVRLLLASRFGLVVHEDMTQTDAWVLTARRDIKMARGNDAERGACRSTPEKIPANSGLSAAITCTNTTMPQLVDRLPGMAPNYIENRPVFDETGLTGTYDFLVLWTGLTQLNGRVNALQPGDKADALAPVGTMKLSDALDRLGLKLTEAKRTVPALVIDRVQPPTEN